MKKIGLIWGALCIIGTASVEMALAKTNNASAKQVRANIKAQGRDHIDLLQQKNSLLQQENALLQKQSDENAALAEQYAQQSDENAALAQQYKKQKHNELRKKRTGHEIQQKLLQERKQKIAELESQLENDKNASEEAKAKLQHQIEQLEQQNKAEMEKLQQETKQQIDEKNQEIAANAQQIADLKAEMESDKTKSAEVKAALEKQLSDLEFKRGQLEQEKNQQIQELRDQIKAAQDQNQRTIEEKDQQLAQKEKELSDQLSKLQQTEQDLAAAIDQKTASQKENEENKLLLAQIRKQIQELQTQLSLTENEADRRKIEVQLARVIFQALAQVMKANKECEAAKQLAYAKIKDWLIAELRKIIGGADISTYLKILGIDIGTLFQNDRITLESDVPYIKKATKVDSTSMRKSQVISTASRPLVSSRPAFVTTTRSGQFMNASQVAG